MLINDIYASISGEVGIIIPQGNPCLIIRTQECNLSCAYCDAPETQSKEGGKEWSVSRLIEIIHLHKLPVLLTGGEPLLQKDIEEFLNTCVDVKIDVQVETNGTIPMIEITEEVGFVVDYKFNAPFIPSLFKYLGSNDYIKFVVSNLIHLQDTCGVIHDNPDFIGHWAISPAQGGAGSLSAKQIVDYMLKYNINATLNIQMHKVIDMY